MSAENDKPPDIQPKVAPKQGLAERAFGAAADEFSKQITPLGKDIGVVTVKVGNLLINGLTGVVFGIEHVANWLRDAVAARLKDIPEEKIVEPNPRIAVPATQALIYSMADKSIRDMFASLLAADMNVDSKDEAHPAFVEIIKEMIPEDAKALQIIGGRAQVQFHVCIGDMGKWRDISSQFSFEIPGIQFEKCARSVTNLRRVGLIEIRENSHPTYDEIEQKEKEISEGYNVLREQLKNEEIGETIAKGLVKDIIIRKNGIYITPLGKSFLATCLKQA